MNPPEGIENRIGTVLACKDIPDCPICGGRSMWWCCWHSPRGNEYYICARCDAKLTDENAMEYIEKLEKLEAEKE